MTKGAIGIAVDVRAGTRTASAILSNTLDDISRRDGALGCFTNVLAERAIAQAARVDAMVAAGKDPGALAGVPFAVKDLFDVKGLPTTAGAALRRDVAPAAEDADAVSRLCAAGAVLVGTLNMDEFAYGFVTRNAHFGTTRNPHDRERLAGGSSGGSAAAVAAGLVPLTLGSDTNGSIRVPASLCGVWGVRPGEGRIDQGGAFPFVHSLDQIGPFAASVADLALAFEVLAGPARPGATWISPRIGRLDGWFVKDASAEVMAAFDAVTARLERVEQVSLPDSAAARSAAFLMTAGEGGLLHAPTLRERAMDYDPATRDRLLAGMMLPASSYIRAREVRALYRETVRAMFERFDILVAPSTPCVAPRIDDDSIMIDGRPAPARAHLGIYTQPLSLVGIPVVSAPVHRPGALPVGLQFAVDHGNEERLFAWLADREAEGLLGGPLAAEASA